MWKWTLGIVFWMGCISNMEIMTIEKPYTILIFTFIAVCVECMGNSSSFLQKEEGSKLDETNIILSHVDFRKEILTIIYLGRLY
jgi:hypothetical protein